MKLQTQIPIQQQLHNQIDYNSNMVLIGSCFAETIGNKFNYYKFQEFSNPFGILFHPIAIENLITNAINENHFSEEDLIFHDERWHSFHSHSIMSHVSKDELLKALNQILKTTNLQLSEASHIILTLGTAWVYRHIESDQVVANCHKLPQKKFLKELLTVDEVSESIQAIVALIRSVNAKAAILFTISPVRHLKDGFVENSRSKSHLNSAVHQEVDPRKNIHYFPSFEILMDELRDYRFYAEDMIHPNQIAIDYVWQKFSATWISTEAKTTMIEVDSIQKGIAHRPFNASSNSHKEFKADLKSKIYNLQANYPHIVF